MVKKRPILSIAAPVSITAGEAEGEKKSPAKFTTTFYTGGSLEIAGWDLPVVIDLAGLSRGNVLVANLDHDRTKRVGNFELVNDGRTLVANGVASAATAARDEVVNSALDGYQWQSSLEVNPTRVEEIKAGKTVTVNGQEFTGPMYVTRKGTLKGFGFVSHGADDNTTVAIAASAAEEIDMDPKIKAWAESMGVDCDNLTPEQQATIEANYAGLIGGKKMPAIDAKDPFAARKAEKKRRNEIRQIADKFIQMRDSDEDEIEAIEKMHDHAIAGGMSPQDFQLEMYESSMPVTTAPIRFGGNTMRASSRVIEAAICQHGRLATLEKEFTDQELQAAHDVFRHGIGLKQLLILAANANGHQTTSFEVNRDVMRAAFAGQDARYPRIHAAGFSGLSISNILAATANKFLRQGWMSVDLTCLRISATRSVSDFKQITTVSLTGDLEYDKVAGDGELKHGTLSDLTYTNQVDTYGRMLAITRKDIINDDLGALTAVPMRLGRGAALKLNSIFWTEFLGLVSASFFASGNSNLNSGVATMTTAGLAATETIFMNQTDPDGNPLGAMPRILLVPTALKADAMTLMESQTLIDGTATAAQGSANIWRGRFRVESSPYVSNSSFTGYTSVGWWMLADPAEYPVIEIAALNGRVEPTVETADADFNTLGIQMRGYSDVGVNEQEYRGGVYADGGSS